jgi:hypothetical protein
VHSYSGAHRIPVTLEAPVNTTPVVGDPPNPAAEAKPELFAAGQVVFARTIRPVAVAGDDDERR